MPNDDAPEQTQFGDFTITRQIGSGGMGVVYEAEQISLRCKVALKIMRSGIGISSRAVQRFRREAEAAARLHHTNIVPVHTFGEHEGVPFYAMELIAGPSLDRVLQQFGAKPDGRTQDAAVTADHDGVATPTSPLPPSASISSLDNSQQEYFDQAARMIADVADALEHAHQEGVVHRDIKPSNLLLSPAGKLSISDFGLARLLDEPGVTATGEFLGTPAYMSPEQIAAGRSPVDHRTDIYSLGATLYEMLAHQRPFQGERRDQVLAQILHKEPRPPRRLNPAVPVDLETICLKALDKDPDNRYQSAAAMADDLRRYLQRFAISARRVGPLRRFVKWVRRHPAISTATTLALVLALVAGYFAWQSWQMREQRRQERLERAVGEVLQAGFALDFDAAMAAVEEAKDAGASPGKMAFLRGFVAVHQKAGKWDPVAELKEAVALMPDDVSAHSLLAAAYYQAGQMDLFYQTRDHVGMLQPQTADDYLFLARVIMYTDPSRGMEMLDEAIRRKNSVMARLSRARLQANLSEKNGLRKHMDRAMEDLTVARNMAPLYKGLEEAGFWVQIRAAVMAEDKPTRDEALKQARLHAARFDEQAGSHGYSILCDEAIEDDAAILRAYSRLKPRQLSYFGAKGVLHALVRAGEFDKARQLLDQTDATGIEVIHAVERGVVEFLAGRPDKTWAAYHEAARAAPSLRSQIKADVLLLLLGEKQKVREGYQAAVRSGLFDKESDKQPYIKWSRDIWHFSGGKLSADDLLALAQSSRQSLCEAYFHIGIDNLAAGDHEAAKDCFKKCTDFRIFHFLEHRWSRSLLVFLERNPDWPKKR